MIYPFQLKKLHLIIGFFVIIIGGMVGFFITHLFRENAPIIVRSLVISKDIPIYTKESAAIIIGTVRNIDFPRWNDDYSMIEREAKVSIDEVIKGDPSWREVSIILEGGDLNGKKIIVEDEADIVAGEKVLLFLGKNSEGKYVIFAGMNGKYIIDSDFEKVSDSEGKVLSLKELKSQISTALGNLKDNQK